MATMTTDEAVQALERVYELTNDAGKSEIKALIKSIQWGLTKPFAELDTKQEKPEKPLKTENVEESDPGLEEQIMAKKKKLPTL